MTEDSGARVSSVESTVANDAAQTRQRKKRKWDQPAESLVSAGVALTGVLPLGNMGRLGGTPLPGVAPVSSVFSINPLVASGTIIPPMFHVPSMHQPPAAVVPKVNQPKIQDELIIAREIVINDAESSVRYKLTKRQTQEEIQRCTSAVVITRGKYRPPNAPPDGEKPLYLHISAGAHLKETAERILAVDRAAAMVEEMLKQGLNTQAGSSTFQTVISNGVKANQALSTCVYLGFDADPSLNTAARIRGPNDQYINHIMNETGATVVLRGRGAGNFESPLGEEVQQPLHLFLSSSNPKSLEDAKHLAENLLDTISVECGASRVSSCKSYSAVPPPQQLLTGVQGSGNEQLVTASSAAGLASSIVGITPVRAIASVTLPGATTVYPQGSVLQSGGMLNCGQPQPNAVSYPQPLLTGGTSYRGYGGIYPQATPLQQVALALRQPPSPVTSMVAPTTSVASTTSKSSVNSTSKEKQSPQKRKFQELPIVSNGPANMDQGSEFLKPSESSTDLGLRNIATMPAPKKLIQPLSKGMPLLPPRSIPSPSSRTMPPPPPKFTSSTPAVKLQDKNNFLNKTKSDTVPDTLIKLMEYGEEDDDPEEASEESFSGNSSAVAIQKPFWAV